MAKKVVGQIKLQIPAGQANPAPPVGPALGQQGVNIMAFCKEFNAATKEQGGMVIPVVITVYKEKVGRVTKKQVMDIVKLKMKDLNAVNEEAAFRVVAGTARSMGIEVVG